MINIESGKESVLTSKDKHSKFFLGDRKTFMRNLKTTLDNINLDMIDPDKKEIIINGEKIEDKNSPGGLLFLQIKISELQDLNRTVIKSFDFVKDIERELRNIIQ
jgi:hypothetical protein